MKKFTRDINYELHQLLQETLIAAQAKPVEDRRWFVRESLKYIQFYCKKAGKTFVFYELAITCDQYDLGGRSHQSATLFRGPNEDASVAICVTQAGSLLRHNDSRWQMYCGAGDVAPAKRGVLAAV
ncbi:MAG: hypothetical protein WA783_06175 [Phormidesmis sp.]